MVRSFPSSLGIICAISYITVTNKTQQLRSYVPLTKSIMSIWANNPQQTKSVPSTHYNHLNSHLPRNKTVEAIIEFITQIDNSITIPISKAMIVAIKITLMSKNTTAAGSINTNRKAATTLRTILPPRHISLNRNKDHPTKIWKRESKRPMLLLMNDPNFHISNNARLRDEIMCTVWHMSAHLTHTCTHSLNISTAK